MVQFVEFVALVFLLGFMAGYGTRSLVSYYRRLRHTRKILNERVIQAGYATAVLVAMLGWVWLLFDLVGRLFGEQGSVKSLPPATRLPLNQRDPEGGFGLFRP